jgi:transposase-like protein
VKVRQNGSIISVAVIIATDVIRDGRYDMLI